MSVNNLNYVVPNKLLVHAGILHLSKNSGNGKLAEAFSVLTAKFNVQNLIVYFAQRLSWTSVVCQQWSSSSLLPKKSRLRVLVWFIWKFWKNWFRRFWKCQFSFWFYYASGPEELCNSLWWLVLWLVTTYKIWLGNWMSGSREPWIDHYGIQVMSDKICLILGKCPADIYFCLSKPVISLYKKGNVT